jgi:hypothetical protein
MSNHKTRLAKLEQRRNEQPAARPQSVEIYGTREDGKQYLVERWDINSDGTRTLTKGTAYAEANHEQP